MVYLSSHLFSKTEANMITATDLTLKQFVLGSSTLPSPTHYDCHNNDIEDDAFDNDNTMMKSTM